MCSLMMISDMLSKHVLAVKSVLKKWFKINYIQLVHLLVVWYLIILVVIPDIKICTSRQCTEQKALANSEIQKWLLNYGSTERNLFHVTVLASRIWMWLFNFWKICGSTGILRLGVLQIAEVTARSVQAMHIWVSFMCIKYTHTRTHPMYLINNSTELCRCGRAREASWQQLQRIAKLTHEWRIPIQKQTCSCSEIGLQLIVMQRLISTM